MRATMLAAFAAVFLTMPQSANAATIRVLDLTDGTTPVEVLDTGALMGASVFNGSFSSGINFTIFVNPAETANASRLQTINITTDGVGDIEIQVSEDGFGAGANGITSSTNRFSVSATSVGNMLEASSFVDDSNTLLGTDNQIGSNLAFNTPFVAGSESQLASEILAPGDLSPLFAITSIFRIYHDDLDDATSFDATHVAAIPLPASIILLFTGLLGLGFLGRNRSKVRRATA